MTTILGVALIAIVGWFVLYALGRALFGHGYESQTTTEALSERHQRQSYERDMLRRKVLDGIYKTPANQRDWTLYNKLKAEHAALDEAENRATAASVCPIDERTGLELRNGVNPYKQTQTQTRAAKLRAEKARR